MKEDTKEIAVQINGKLKATVNISVNASKEEAIEIGKKAVEGKLSGNIIKEIYVPGKIINIVCK